MLLWLADYLTQYHSGFNVFRYLTFRGILGALTALVISLIIGPSMIRKLTMYKIGQRSRDTDNGGGADISIGSNKHYFVDGSGKSAGDGGFNRYVVIWRYWFCR